MNQDTESASSPRLTAKPDSSFAPLAIARYQIVLRVEEALVLPSFKGATLRGAFGATLKRIACHRDAAACPGTAPDCACAYGQLFAPKMPEGCRVTRVNPGDEVARPFVFEPPLDDRREFAPGDELVFHLNLFGHAAQFLPYFLVAFRELPPLGLPSKRGRVVMRQVWVVDDSSKRQQVYSSEDQLVRNVSFPITLPSAHTPTHPSAHTVVLDFQTNTILRYLSNKEGVPRIEFHILMSRLLQRIETLAALYSDDDGQPVAASPHRHVAPLFLAHTPRDLINLAKQVRIARDETRWNEWKRYAAYQQREVPMSGVVGRIQYALPPLPTMSGDGGDGLAPFLPYLWLGQYTHVGRGCVFGLGKFVVLEGAGT